MISFFDFLHDLSHPSLGFLPRALLAAILSSVLCALVGTHVILRGLSFVGDALAHAVFPGIALAFATGTSLVLGGVVAGITVAIFIALFSQNRHVGEDSFVGIFYAAAFSCGLVIIARVPGYTGSLDSFLFGSLTGVSDTDVIVSFLVALGVGAVLFFSHSWLVSVSVDREFSRSRGIHVMLVDLLFYVLIAVTVVISVRTIGNILVLALLITPAATARMLTDRLGVMLVISPLIGGMSAFCGIYFSWAFDVPTGAAIVLVATVFFVLVSLCGPRGALLQLRMRN